MTDQSLDCPHLHLHLLKKLNSLNTSASSLDLCGSVMTPKEARRNLFRLERRGFVLRVSGRPKWCTSLSDEWEITDAGRAALKEFQK